MNPQPVLFTNRPGRLSGSKRSRSGGHVTRMWKSEMQRICFLLDSHDKIEKKKRMSYQNGSQRNWVPSARLFTVLVQPNSSAMAVRPDVSHDHAGVGTTTNSHTNSTTAGVGKFPATTFCSMAAKLSA